jgi:hypothetical protein
MDQVKGATDFKFHQGYFKIFTKKPAPNVRRRYLGDKIGLYFCWLGFYTKMLILPAVMGILVSYHSKQGRYKYRSGIQKSQHQQQKRHWKSKVQGD